MTNVQDFISTSSQDIIDGEFVPSGKLSRPLDTEHAAAEEEVRTAAAKAFTTRDKKADSARKIEEKMGRTMAQIDIYQNAVDRAKEELSVRKTEVEQMDLLIDAAIEARAQANGMREDFLKESLRYHSIPEKVREADPSLGVPLNKMRAALAERDGLVNSLETAINKIFYNH
jgi:chromosome segregation ATPase